MMQKKTQGRKKTNMKKIDEHSSCQVTFSKRRSALFNKASELCVLTGAEVAILLESPGGRVYSFGSPSVESVMGRYLGETSTGAPDPQKQGSELERDMQEYSEICKELEAERNKKAAPEELKEKIHWWQKSIEGLGVEELTQRIAKMEELRSIWAKDVLEMVIEYSTLDPTQNPINDNNDQDDFPVDDPSQNPSNDNNDHYVFPVDDHDVFPVDDYDYLVNEPEDDLGYNFAFGDDEQVL